MLDRSLATFATAVGARRLVLASLEGAELRVVASSDPELLGLGSTDLVAFEPALRGLPLSFEASLLRARQEDPLLSLADDGVAVALALREAEPPLRLLLGLGAVQGVAADDLAMALATRVPILAAHLQALDSIDDALVLLAALAGGPVNGPETWLPPIVRLAGARVGARWTLTVQRGPTSWHVALAEGDAPLDASRVRPGTLLRTEGPHRFAATARGRVGFLRLAGVGRYLGHTLRLGGGTVVHMGLVFEQGAWCGWRQETAVDLLARLVPLELERRAAVEARLRIEQRLAERQRTESLTRVARGVAHDLNNLLGVVSANASFAAGADIGAQARRESLEDVVAAAEHGAALARQLTSYAGSHGGDRYPLELGAFVRGVERLLRATAGGAIRVDVRPGDEPTWVVADPVQLSQVLVNLVANAAEAIGDAHGTIRVASGRRDVDVNELLDALVGDERPAGPYAFLEVSDDGPGIPAEVVRRVCDPFYSTKGGSRGLGLSAVRGLVDVHGGALRLRAAAPGAGATFEVLLPLADSAPPLLGIARA